MMKEGVKLKTGHIEEYPAYIIVWLSDISHDKIEDCRIFAAAL